MLVKNKKINCFYISYCPRTFKRLSWGIHLPSDALAGSEECHANVQVYVHTESFEGSLSWYCMHKVVLVLKLAGLHSSMIIMFKLLPSPNTQYSEVKWKFYVFNENAWEKIRVLFYLTILLLIGNKYILKLVVKVSKGHVWIYIVFCARRCP